jgi:VRR-NUC domain-containing protein
MAPRRSPAGVAALGSMPATPVDTTAPITETAWQDWIAELARLHGWRAAHFRPARTMHGWRTAVGYDGAGWPDLVLVHPQRRLILYREVKTDRGRRRPEQERWAAWLGDAGADYAIWQPRHRPEVVELLTDGKARAL